MGVVLLLLCVVYIINSFIKDNYKSKAIKCKNKCIKLFY